MCRSPRAPRGSSRTATWVALVGCALAARPGFAAEGVVTAPEIPVRSAPFEVAPTLSRVHAGDRLTADEKPQGEWRRVQLADGRFGYVHDADLTVRVVAPAPMPSAPVPVPSAEGGAAGGPATPLEQASPPASGPPAGPAASSPVGAPPGPEPAAPPREATLLGVMFELLPVGTLSLTAPADSSGADVSNDSVFAVAVAPFVDLPVSPYVAIGASPQVVFRVKAGSTAGQSATELDLRARLTARLPMSPNVRVFGRVSPAFSIVSLPASAPGTPAPDPKGFLVDLSVGTEVAVLPKLFVVIDLGYQLGFQSSSAPDGTIRFDGTRYLHLGGGFAIGL